ncbi:helix-turn-helix domain-containing protein [Mycolicibacterium flavescens]|uniref:ABC transporter substrate-binding protein n=1 Tax=Mycolicibacterium flavescens TaxID=1776 RepID=A0A1E3R8H2_MYCFV|nr:helix-turn-helix domain-containing protein [Mycolicibacterium flavescens]MCV7282003.1 helix-turn-helix domain-containing protein [Mycolicibacterium flavescens]ODQ86051.1 ABC transporter substrate-binding protein [Mycolicibacterium flavescens]
MEALVARLSRLDSDAEGALRVVTFFDTLMRRRVDLPGLARAAAGLAECTAGIRLHAGGRVIRMGADGRPATAPAPASTAAAITIDGEDIGSVWLERSGQARSLDELALDRLALAVAAAVERFGPAPTTMADPALVELVISGETDDAARSRALRLLGFAPRCPLHVVAVRSRHPLDRIAAQVCADAPVKAAALDDVGVLLAGAVDDTRFPADACVGIGAADAVTDAWRQARTALRFATARRPVVHHDGLGALALLAELPEGLTRHNPDVAAVARLAASADDLDTLDAYCATASLRRAAEVLHLHHSSVARRLENLSRALGFTLTEPDGLLRASLALTAWRLL